MEQHTIILAIAAVVIISIALPTEAMICPDGFSAIEHCADGFCPSGFYCYMGWCCRSRRYGGAIGSCPTCGRPVFGMRGCPDGSAPYGTCPTGYCPFNYNCIRGVCCKAARYVKISSRGCPKVYGPIYEGNDRCFTDQDCAGGKICCKSRYGKRCMYPL
ncbi:WAP-type 'four-disulfide core [Trichuris suis]|uniref:WAP domain-containing protein n=1 Tax=Trichuris suis TaxID=68888 RepID=A0A085LKH2_9BILA|nr:hypothetical protein M513_13671 [Trichuris suis]KFD45468.1 hypothetical protein M513_13658 [Trichuris suis]KHJ45364.1 WAP-type 'four-disulfide core [Trichuris suis]